MNKPIDANLFEQKLAILNMAMELYSITLPAEGFTEKKDHIAGYISTAKKIEDFILAKDDNVQVDPEAAKRQAFLDSLPQPGCGRGRDNCDGSEGTCTCQ